MNDERIADWCGLCYQRISSEGVAALLLVVMTILLIWGLTMMLAPYRPDDTSRRRALRRKHWQPPRFVLWLGVFMVWDAVTYGLLVAAVFKARGIGTDAWVLIPFVGLAVSAVIAFVLWAREKVVQNGGRHDPV